MHVVQKPEVGKWAGADIMESVYMTLDSWLSEMWQFQYSVKDEATVDAYVDM